VIQHPEIEGAVNIAAPGPLPNREFMRVLRKAWGVRLGLPAARWMLEIGALLLGTESELILKSRRVVPGRLLDAGFSFRYPTCRTRQVTYVSAGVGERGRGRYPTRLAEPSRPRRTCVRPKSSFFLAVWSLTGL
jgi:hypothetical protein